MGSHDVKLHESSMAESQPTREDPPSVVAQKIYIQHDAWSGLLSGLDNHWEILPLSENYCGGVCSPAIVITAAPNNLDAGWLAAIRDDRVRVLCAIDGDGQLPEKPAGLLVTAIQLDAPRPVLRSQIAAAFENLTLLQRQRETAKQIERTQSDIDRLNEIGVALSSQHDRESLLNLILRISREITQSDAGSLYLVENHDENAPRLRFTLTQNDSIRVPFSETFLAIDGSSIAGYVALSGTELVLDDVYRIPASLPFRFNSLFDEESGYRCKSMLAMPMKNPQGEITGVVQLINCKRDPAARVDGQNVDTVVVPFSAQCRPMLRSLASQAAVAIENIRLYESIETLFEGFVRASVSAIESRDPTTSGHSFRVADLTVGLAQAVDQAGTGPFHDIHFSRAEMKEIRYASLLHDFGKVGVREQVLVKAKKLYPGQLELIQQRFAYARKALEHAQSERNFTYLLEQGRDEFLRRQSEFHGELQDQLRDLDEFLAFVVRCNEPTLLREGNFAGLAEVAARHIVAADGRELALVSAQEARLLSIPRGSLDEAERLQIETHVSHTQSFLQQIPWTKEIRNVPAIAAAHHEKLDGSGYPRSLTEKDIPVQSKMMTIADIFDALSAQDRPYKPAVPWERALDILYDEARKGLIDPALLELFRAAEIFRVAANWKPS